MTARVCKTTFTFVVLHEDDNPPATLEYAISESFDGSMVGLVVGVETVLIRPADVNGELRAIGNDGTFFDGDEA